jgi:hypothetical protein
MKQKYFSKIAMWVLIILSLVLIIYIVVYIIRYYNHNLILFNPPQNYTHTEYDFKPLSPNEIGDSIGGILNPIIGLCATMLTFLAFYMQKMANDQVRDQFKEQKIIDFKQNFENTFFNLVSIHHQIVNTIDFRSSKIYYLNPDIKEYIIKNDIYNKEYIEDLTEDHSLQSRDVFKFSSDILFTLVEDELIFNGTIKNKNDKATIDSMAERYRGLKFKKYKITYRNEFITSHLIEIYNFVYNNLATDFGHYFRNLYRIIKMIHETEFDKNQINNYKIKYSYTSIIRAQLSDDEISWLFFNALSNRGRKFKPLLEKYSLLKGIAINNKTYKYYSVLYDTAAFINPITDSEIDTHLKKESMDLLIERVREN